MKSKAVITAALALSCVGAAAQDLKFPPEQIKRGASLFAMNCATCHGAHMRDPQWAIDLKKFPRDAHTRFVDSVTYGKGNMPSWDDVLSPEDIEALWSYVVAGEPDN
jgi:mono/diheme cytochrome c family protein